MRFLDFIKKYKIRVLFFAIIAIIVFAISIIYYIDNYPNLSSHITVKNNLIGLDKLEKNITSLSSKDSTVAKNGNFQKMIKKLNNATSSNLSREKRYNALQNAKGDLEFAYADTNNHNLYILEENFDDFIRTNFPEKKISNNKPYCFDPSCADSPQPKEILNIIEEIKNSNVPKVLKDSTIKDLTNFGYLNKDVAYFKAGDYLIVANDIKNNRDYINAGISLKIYQEIIDYVKTTFPNEYKKLQQ